MVKKGFDNLMTALMELAESRKYSIKFWIFWYFPRIPQASYGLRFSILYAVKISKYPRKSFM